MKKYKMKKAMTLVELMVAMVISTIVILAVAVVLCDSQKAWKQMYDDTNSDVAVQSLMACKRFDAVVRPASSANCTIDPAGNWVEVNYYSIPSAANLDRYARFSWVGSQLTHEYGILSSKTILGTYTLCNNVTACKFVKVGNSIQMALTLNDSTRASTVVSSNVMNNN